MHPGLKVSLRLDSKIAPAFIEVSFAYSPSLVCTAGGQIL